MDIRTISRAAGAAALVIGPLASAAPIVVTDGENSTVAEQLADYAANPGAAQASNVLLLLIIAVVPAMIYAARLARPGAPRLAFLGGALAALGWLAGLISIGAGQIALYQGSRLCDQAAAAALIEAMNADPVYGSLVGVFVIGGLTRPLGQSGDDDQVAAVTAAVRVEVATAGDQAQGRGGGRRWTSGALRWSRRPVTRNRTVTPSERRIETVSPCRRVPSRWNTVGPSRAGSTCPTSTAAPASPGIGELLVPAGGRVPVR